MIGIRSETKNNIMRYYSIVIIFLLSVACCYAQAQPIGKQNRVIISGKSYIIHIVKRGETLYNISKTYNIPYDSLTAANPLVLPTSLEIGSALKIPYLEADKKTVSKFKDSVPPYHIVQKGENIYRISLKYNLKPSDIYKLNPGSEVSISVGQKLLLHTEDNVEIVDIEQDKQFIYHTVQEKETLLAISRKYGVKLEDLKKYNSKLKDNDIISVGEKIRVPRDMVEVITQVSTTQTDTTFQYHKVKPKETLFSISRLYEVSIDEIKTINPALNSRELMAGELLKLPIKQLSEETTRHEPTQEPIVAPCPCKEQNIYRTVKVGLMLPFYTNINDTLTQTRTIPQIFERSRQFVEFYQGLLLAMNDLKEKNLLAELHVFDTQNSQYVVRQICNSSDFKNLDLIIGPAFSKNIEIVSQEAKKYNIPIVSPLSTDDKFLEDNENAFMVSPSQKIQDDESIKHINDIKSDSYVVIFDGNQYDSTYIPALKQHIFNKYTPETIGKLKYTEFTYHKGMETQLMDLFTNNDSVVIIMPSRDKAFVSDIVARLNTLTAEKSIILFGQPRWSRFDNIKLEFFHNLNTHLFSLSYCDYTKENVINFVRQYRAFYNTEPSNRAFEGYDIAKYFIGAVHRYGKDFRCCLDKYKPELLHMFFDMKQTKSGTGYANHHLYMIHYMKNFERSIKTIEN